MCFLCSIASLYRSPSPDPPFDTPVSLHVDGSVRLSNPVVCVSTNVHPAHLTCTPRVTSPSWRVTFNLQKPKQLLSTKTSQLNRRFFTKLQTKKSTSNQTATTTTTTTYTTTTTSTTTRFNSEAQHPWKAFLRSQTQLQFVYLVTSLPVTCSYLFFAVAGVLTASKQRLKTSNTWQDDGQKQRSSRCVLVTSHEILFVVWLLAAVASRATCFVIVTWLFCRDSCCDGSERHHYWRWERDWREDTCWDWRHWWPERSRCAHKFFYFLGLCREEQAVLRLLLYSNNTFETFLF